MNDTPAVHRLVQLFDKAHLPGEPGRRAQVKLSNKTCVMCNERLTVQEHAKYLMVCSRCGENGRKHVWVDQNQRVRITGEGEAY